MARFIMLLLNVNSREADPYASATSILFHLRLFLFCYRIVVFNWCTLTNLKRQINCGSRILRLKHAYALERAHFLRVDRILEYRGSRSDWNNQVFLTSFYRRTGLSTISIRSGTPASLTDTAR